MNGARAGSHAARRAEMVRKQLEARDIRNPRVLAAMGRVPRHAFVPPDLHERAYGDEPLRIGHGQTISQPYIVALMTQLTLGPQTRRALDVGTGSGYQAAVLAEIYDEVWSIENVPELSEAATGRLRELRYQNVRLHCGDGQAGWPGAEPFDAIVVACASAEIPPALVDQLAPGARLALPVGRFHQELTLVEKLPDASTRTTPQGPVAFVPMTAS